MLKAMAIWGTRLVRRITGSADVTVRRWIEVRPAGGGYRIEMPGAPKMSTQVAELPDGHFDLIIEALVETPTVAYVATHVDYPPGFLEKLTPEKRLDIARDSSAEGHTLRDERHLTIGGHPAREYVIQHAQGLVLIIRSVVAHDRHHQVTVSGPPGVEHAPETRRFLDSFALTSP